jgi:S-layer homology domain
MSDMRQLAMVLAAALVFAVISPAFAQPFADTPTNHWAYDAIAELAAKGLIEGYPDGTFKGDRAMTRYEMAMVVARLLARIESIQIPTPPPPQVTRADIDMILRLVNEFRAELAAKNVRLTAVEEELNAIKARLSNVRIIGGLRFREDLNQLQGSNPSGGGDAFTNSLNGNPKTSAFSA